MLALVAGNCVGRPSKLLILAGRDGDADALRMLDFALRCGFSLLFCHLPDEDLLRPVTAVSSF